MNKIREIICNSYTKLTVEEIRPGMDRLTVFELMGGRWVKLGPSETWDTETWKQEYMEG